MSEITASENRIIILDEHTANRIAAGEVIERPASVVKELVENSIDAGATQIRIFLEDGGRELIRVADNGVGMTREDAVVSLQRHATSKIRSADDLFSIRTLGFRGEALPSIASVSLFEMVTKHAGESAGTKLEAEAGTITNLESVGAPQGTTVTVRKLFFNTPARLKFMRGAQTELSHIVELVGRLSIAHPNVGFRLTHGDRDLLVVSGDGNSESAVVSVYGRDVAKELVRIGFESPGLKVGGYVSRPEFTRANRTLQVFFVNRRPVRNKALTHAVDQAYRDLIVQQGRYPAVIVMVDIDPDLVDVNVHPTKAEVKFSREQDVHHAVYHAVRDALMSGGAAASAAVVSELSIKPRQDVSAQGVLIDSAREESRTAVLDAVLRGSASQVDGDPFEWGAVVASTGTETELVPQSVCIGEFKVVGQIRNMYIAAESADGVLIVDQHVAHERIIYDRLVLARAESGAPMQGLVIPITLSLSRRESVVVGERLDDLRSVGFDIEPFGGDTFIVRAVPAGEGGQWSERLLRDIIDELVEVTVARHIIAPPDQVLITTACKMAIKAGDSLTLEEMHDLLARLFATSNPFICPHGRPIIITISNRDLDRRFKRPV